MTTVLRPSTHPAQVRTAEPVHPGRNPDLAPDTGRDAGAAGRPTDGPPAWHFLPLRPRDSHLSTLLSGIEVRLHPDGTAEVRLPAGDPLTGTWHGRPDAAILLTTATGERSLDGYLTRAEDMWRLDAVYTGPARPGMTIAHVIIPLLAPTTEPSADRLAAERRTGGGGQSAGESAAEGDAVVACGAGMYGIDPLAGGSAVDALTAERQAVPIAVAPSTVASPGSPHPVPDGGTAVPAPEAVEVEPASVRELRRRLERPSLAGRWQTPTGALRDVTVTASAGTTFARCTDVRPVRAGGEAEGFLRLAWQLDVAVGLVAGPDGWKPVALSRRDRPDLSAFGPTDASALRRLGLELVSERRYGEAAPLLDRAAALYAAAVSPDTSAAIDLLTLADARLFCAFAERAFHRVPDLLLAVADVRRGVTIGPVALNAWRDTVTFLTGTATDVHRTLCHLAAAATAAPACPPALRDAATAAAATAAALCDDLRAADPTIIDPKAVEAAARTLATALTEAERSLRATAAQLTRVERQSPAAESPTDGDTPQPAADAAGTFTGDGGPRRSADGSAVSIAGDGEPRPSAADAAVPSPRDTTIMTIRGSADIVSVLRQHLERADPGNAARGVRDFATKAARISARFVERWRALLDSHWDKILSTDQALPFYERMVTLLLDIDASEDALVASEMSRARAFADALREARAEPHPHTSTGGALAGAPPLSRAALRVILARHDAAVVEYFLTGDLLVVWVCPRGGPVTPVTRRIDRAALTADVAEFNRLARLTMQTSATRTAMADVLRRLGATLWDVIPHGLLPTDPDEPVTVIPHRELFQVPFAALRDERGGYLVHRHAIRVLPALALVPDLVTAAAAASAGPESLVALVNPEPLPEERPLRLLEANFADITELYGEHVRHVATRGAANLATLREVAAEGTVLFFGTHAHAVSGAGRDPLTSYLLLAPSPGHDGYLRARDVPGLGVGARLVILAACETGGGEVTADGVIGLSRAFLTSGPSALITTLYPVGERACLEVMTAFHEEWLLDGHEPVSALRRAMALVADWQSATAPEPHVWAAFTYFGLGVPAWADGKSPSSPTSQTSTASPVSPTAGRTVA